MTHMLSALMLAAAGAVLTLSGAFIVTSLPPLYSFADATPADLIGGLYMLIGAASLSVSIGALR